MKRFLGKVGVSQITLDNIASIVQSCPVCREWSRPGPSNISTTSAPDKFNQQVEVDLHAHQVELGDRLGGSLRAGGASASRGRLRAGGLDVLGPLGLVPLERVVDSDVERKLLFVAVRT